MFRPQPNVPPTPAAVPYPAPLVEESLYNAAGFLLFQTIFFSFFYMNFITGILNAISLLETR